MCKTYEPKKLGSGTSGGTNGPDVVMVRVSLCDVLQGQTGRGSVVANQRQGLASQMSHGAEQ